MENLFSYDLADFLMFSPSVYYRLVEFYNIAVWPWQVPLLATLSASLLYCYKSNKDWIVLIVLSVLWGGVAKFFFIDHFQEIMWAANYIAAVFIAQAIVMLASAFLLYKLPPTTMKRPLVPLCLLLATVGFYPLFCMLFGQSALSSDVVGLMPDPTVLLTVGLFALIPRVHMVCYIIPIVWIIFSTLMLHTMQASIFWLLPLLTLIFISIRKGVSGYINGFVKEDIAG